jgi:hypothetical protein
MTFREQVEAIREAEVVVGNHGAGLSHLVFMDQGSHVIEFQMNNLMFFVHLTECKGGQVTLHQLPDVRSSVSDEYLNTLLLPKFFDIYGGAAQPPPPPPASQDVPQLDRVVAVDLKPPVMADPLDAGRKAANGQQPNVGGVDGQSENTTAVYSAGDAAKGQEGVGAGRARRRRR